MHIVLDTELTPDGIVCRNATLGKVATIKRNAPGSEAAKQGPWYVFPYSYPPYERGANFHSLDGAKAYALALAYDMHTDGLPKHHG